MESSLNRFKDKFIEEANSLLDQVEKDLLELESKPDDKELIESAFRALHTIKGASSMFGFDFICEFSHHLETLYQLIREKKLKFTCDIFEITLQSVDHIRKLLGDDNFSIPANQQNHRRLLNSIHNIIEHKKEPSLNDDLTETKESSWHIILRTTESIFFRGINLTSIFSELATIGEYEISKIENLSDENTDTWSILLKTKASEQTIRNIFLFVEDDCSIVRLTHENILNNFDFKHVKDNTQQEISILDYIEDQSKQKEVKPNLVNKIKESLIQEKQASKRISVDAAKIDHLMFLVSELITVNSQLNMAAYEIRFDSLRPCLEKIDSLSKQFRNSALEIRLVPLSDTVLRFQRLTRDLSRQLNKKINFLTQGTNTELDKNTIDQITEPLMHIIRNCIDHGIEKPEARLKQGKPEHGTITLSAYNSGNNVFITISDDGSGIDYQKIYQKAIEKGLLKESDKLEEKELYDLIFKPGFSTAKALTEVSGRGVGLDVVKRKIKDLRGEIIVDSKPGAGTSFTLKLQQSMSIIDSLLFSVDQCYFTVPISEIIKCGQLNEKNIHTSTLPFNNHLIPYIDLRKLFLLGNDKEGNTKTIILRSNDKELALLCDKIIGEHQAVLKPLGKSFSNQQYITAASQMGNGKMAFMIDTNALFKFEDL